MLVAYMKKYSIVTAAILTFCILGLFGLSFYDVHSELNRLKAMSGKTMNNVYLQPKTVWFRNSYDSDMLFCCVFSIQDDRVPGDEVWMIWSLWPFRKMQIPFG
jgi:hypothetical protein